MSILADTFTSGEVVDRRFEEIDVFKVMMERSGLCMASLDAERRVLDANGEFLSQFGRMGEPLHGCDFMDLLHPGVRQPIERHFERLEGGRRARFVEHMVGVGGEDRCFTGELTGFGVHDRIGALVMTVVVVRPEVAAPGVTIVADSGFSLSELDARILEEIANGESTARIATKLFLSRQGVEYHMGAMFRALKVPNRAALVSKAFSMGLFSSASWPPKVRLACVK